MNSDDESARLAMLERYASLRERGILTVQEYECEKARLLCATTPSRASDIQAIDQQPGAVEMAAKGGVGRMPSAPPHRSSQSPPELIEGATAGQALHRSDGRDRIWMSNWERGLVFPLLWAPGAMLLYFGIGQYTIFLSVPIAIVLFISGMRGITFNLGKDDLTLPYFLFRRQVRLSEIYDANCEFETAIFGGDLSIGYYMVNLSGDFGSRQLTFVAKSRRDQFLSLLRRYSSDECQITRWS